MTIDPKLPIANPGSISFVFRDSPTIVSINDNSGSSGYPQPHPPTWPPTLAIIGALSIGFLVNDEIVFSRALDPVIETVISSAQIAEYFGSHAGSQTIAIRSGSGGI